MRTQELTLSLKPSKIPLVAVIFTFILASFIMCYLPFLKVGLWCGTAMMSIYWLYKYLTFPYYQININTISKAIQIRLTTSPMVSVTHIANLLQIKSTSWWLTTIKLAIITDQKVKKITVPIFMDSIPLKQYKSFRMFALW